MGNNLRTKSSQEKLISSGSLLLSPRVINIATTFPNWLWLQSGWLPRPKSLWALGRDRLTISGGLTFCFKCFIIRALHITETFSEQLCSSLISCALLPPFQMFLGDWSTWSTNTWLQLILVKFMLIIFSKCVCEEKGNYFWESSNPLLSLFPPL